AVEDVIVAGRQRHRYPGARPDEVCRGRSVDVRYVGIEESGEDCARGDTQQHGRDTAANAIDADDGVLRVGRDRLDQFQCQMRRNVFVVGVDPRAGPVGVILVVVVAAGGRYQSKLVDARDVDTDELGLVGTGKAGAAGQQLTV